MDNMIDPAPGFCLPPATTENLVKEMGMTRNMSAVVMSVTNI